MLLIGEARHAALGMLVEFGADQPAFGLRAETGQPRCR